MYSAPENVSAVNLSFKGSPKLKTPPIIEVKSFLRILEDKLKNVITSLIDKDSYVDLGIITLSPQEKYGTGGAYAISNFMQEVQNISKIATNIRQKLFDLEKNVQNFLTS